MQFTCSNWLMVASSELAENLYSEAEVAIVFFLSSFSPPRPLHTECIVHFLFIGVAHHELHDRFIPRGAGDSLCKF